MISFLLFCVIELSGVSGENLRARAFFDANNVKVGDPLVLSVDFLGEATFDDLHPPALARHVSRADWKLDDRSAKTMTVRGARRLTYRVRPIREGLLWFPALEFSYRGSDGAERIVKANAIPVHAKKGVDVVVEGMGEDPNEMPEPPELVAALDEATRADLSPDALFAWKKACAHPTAEGFAAFDFPAARMNEATCAIKAGNWAKALSIYRVLEWRIGQTPEIEKGLRAALALKFDNPAVGLPMWRQVLRPVLKYDWKLRAALVLGGFAAVLAVLWLLGRMIRLVACLALVCLPLGSLFGQGIFQQMEEHMRQMQQRMNQMTSGFSMSFGGEEREPVKITAGVALSKKAPQVGEAFDFILSLEAPRTASIGQIRITPSENFGLTFTGQAQNLADGKSANPTNVVKRLLIPARYDIPYRGRIAFRVDGMVTGRETRNGGRFSFSFSNSFSAETPPVEIAIRPLPTANQPADFAGVVSEGLRVHEYCDILTVETNDVVTITYRMHPKGYVPEDFQPKDVAFEAGREVDREGRPMQIEYRRYFVADGATVTPKLTISYYDPRTKSYRTATCGGTQLKYVTIDEPKAKAKEKK